MAKGANAFELATTIMKLIGKVNGTTDVKISYIKEFLTVFYKMYNTLIVC